MSNTTFVIFRKDRAGRKECFALFPELPSDVDGFFCTAYQTIGQHCSADYRRCIEASDPASPNEFASLAEELEKRGYQLNIRNRATPAMHERRRWLAAMYSTKRENRA